MLAIPITPNNWRETLELFVALNNLDPKEAEEYFRFIEALMRPFEAARIVAMANVNEL